MGFYPGARTVTEAFTEGLRPFKHGKGSVQFPLDRRLPADLIRRMVEFRVSEMTDEPPGRPPTSTDGSASQDLEERVRRVTSEPFEIAEYDPAWPAAYESEKRHLLAVFPAGSVLRIEHVGSTAVPGLAAKPIIDILVGVKDLSLVHEQVVPMLEERGYEYFWRPTLGEDGPPFYAWFIRRDDAGARTHHIHVVEMGFREHWDWVLFRDHLIARPSVASEYARLKRRLATEFAGDRAGYTQAKSSFILDVLERARRMDPGAERSEATSRPGGEERPKGSSV